MKDCTQNRQVLNAQKGHWEDIYAEESDFFGEEPSYSAKKAAETFKTMGKSKILELGAGQGRDALFFVSQGFNVTALDYSETAVSAIKERAEKLKLPKNLSTLIHDVRKPFPFEDDSFDACYCHMLYCMALCTSELETLFQEVRRVLKPEGLNVFTVRNTSDPHYKQGIPRGEDMFETGGFIVHFFSREKIRHLSKGYEIISIEEFEEGELPRKLFLVCLRKKK